MPAADTGIRYEVGNALGRLNADRPHLAARVTQNTEFAKALRYMLNAIDGYQDRSGASLEEVRQHIRHGRIELRCHGDRVTVVTP